MFGRDSKLKKVVVNSVDRKERPNITQYDFRDFSQELNAIQNRNKVIKKLEKIKTIKVKSMTKTMTESMFFLIFISNTYIYIFRLQIIGRSI